VSGQPGRPAVRVAAGVALGVLVLLLTTVLGLGRLVSVLAGAGDAARTQAVQRELSARVPAPVMADASTGMASTGPAANAGGEPVSAEVSTRIDRGAAPAPTAARAAVGEPLAVMRIPRFGADWRWVALEGTADEVIADGPGHYSLTPLPGDRGNVAFAAHRAGHGDPFLDFDRLRRGDRVILSQRGTRWVYELESRPAIVPTTASWVLNPLPGRRLTLTTCWPKYGSAKRMYVRGTLVATRVG
jgi:sortase A